MICSTWNYCDRLPAMVIFLDVTARVADEVFAELFNKSAADVLAVARDWGLSCQVGDDEAAPSVKLTGSLSAVNSIHKVLEERWRSKWSVPVHVDVDDSHRQSRATQQAKLDSKPGKSLNKKKGDTDTVSDVLVGKQKKNNEYVTCNTPAQSELGGQVLCRRSERKRKANTRYLDDADTITTPQQQKNSVLSKRRSNPNKCETTIAKHETQAHSQQAAVLTPPQNHQGNVTKQILNSVKSTCTCSKQTIVHTCTSAIIPSKSDDDETAGSVDRGVSTGKQVSNHVTHTDDARSSSLVTTVVMPELVEDYRGDCHLTLRQEEGDQHDNGNIEQSVDGNDIGEEAVREETVEETHEADGGEEAVIEEAVEVTLEADDDEENNEVSEDIYLESPLLIKTDNRIFHCPDCSYVAAAVSDVQRHYCTEHLNQQNDNNSSLLEKTIQCDKCGEIVPRKGWYRTHACTKRLVKHKAEKEFACNQCDKSFAIRQSLYRHGLITHANQKPIKLTNDDNCDKSELFNNYIQQDEKLDAENKAALMSIGTEADESGMFSCPQCEFNSDKYEKIHAHFIRTHGKKSWCCLLCQRTTALEKDLRKHISLVHIDRSESNTSNEVRASRYRTIPGLESICRGLNGKFQCPGCEYSSAEKRYVADHYIRSHIGKKTFKCDQCDNVYCLKKDVLRHKKMSHHEKKTVICDVCGKSFKSEWYRIHRKAHAVGKTPTQIIKPVVRRSFACEQCGLVFGQRQVFLNHLEMEHLQTKEHFKCPVCNRPFIDKKRWKAHSLTHLGIRQFSCSICAKLFATLACLRSHMVCHRAKTIPCPVCKKLFGTATHVKEHMKFHKPKTDFICPICGKGCTVKSELNAHMKVHQDYSPYECLLCGKKFKFSYRLKRHVISVHDVSPKSKDVLEQSMHCPQPHYDVAKHSDIRAEWIKQEVPTEKLHVFPFSKDYRNDVLTVEPNSRMDMSDSASYMEIQKDAGNEMEMDDAIDTASHATHLLQDETTLSSASHIPVSVGTQRLLVQPVPGCNEQFVIEAIYNASEVLANMGSSARVFVTSPSDGQHTLHIVEAEQDIVNEQTVHVLQDEVTIDGQSMNVLQDDNGTVDIHVLEDDTIVAGEDICVLENGDGDRHTVHFFQAPGNNTDEQNIEFV